MASFDGGRSTDATRLRPCGEGHFDRPREVVALLWVLRVLVTFRSSRGPDAGTPATDGNLRDAYQGIRQRLDNDHLVILNERVFGDVSTAASVVEIRAADSETTPTTR